MTLPAIGITVLLLMIGILALLSNRKGRHHEELLLQEGAVEISDTGELVNQIKQGKPGEKVKAIEELAKIELSNLGELLVEALADKNEEVKMAAATALVKRNDPQTVPLLVAALRDPRCLPARVAEVLIAIGEPAAQELIKATGDEDEAVRASAIQILGMIPFAAKEEVLIAALQDKAVEVRRATASAVAELENICEYPALFDALEDEDSRVRVQVVKALGKIYSEQAIDRLSKATSDPDWSVAASAVGALARLGDQGRQILEHIASDETHPAHKQAAGYLKKSRDNRHKPLVKINFGKDD